MGGQIILYKYNHKINNLLLEKDNYIEYVNKIFIQCLQYSSLPVIMYWLKFYNSKDNNFEMKYNIFTNIFYNKDDRVYKYFFKNYNIINDFNSSCDNKYNNHMIKEILQGIFDCSHPIKYQLRRLKFLSNHINLENYFDLIFEYGYNNIQVFLTLLKYYYTKPIKLINNLGGLILII